jgi:hypothetical protein
VLKSLLCQIAGRAERRAQREQERVARVQAMEAQLADETQRPGRVIVAVPPGTNPPPGPPVMNVVIPEANRLRPGNVPAAFGNWTFSPLTLRRPRRPEDGAGQPVEPANAVNAVTIRWRPRDDANPVPVVSSLDETDSNNQTSGIQVAVQTDAGPSRSDGNTDTDDAMIIE